MEYHFCVTVDRSIGTVSDSRMKAHYFCPESLRLVTFTRGLHRLVDPRHHQDTPREFVIVFVMKSPNADRTVAWSTNRDLTRTVATNTQTALEILSHLHQSSQRNDVP